ncbi:MAG: hypothetical protein E5W39_09155 [Mesorhizobium sp.]|nr:MAG: hypothetical protein E5W39_09155 [Mesorhizobium sp.]
MRKRNIIAAAGVATILLSGCSGSGLGMPGSPAWFATTPQAEQATYFRNRCVSYGFEPGTPAMAQCIQNESISSRGRASARANAAFANMQNSQPKTTTCSRFGNTVNCTTFLGHEEQEMTVPDDWEVEGHAISLTVEINVELPLMEECVAQTVLSLREVADRIERGEEMGEIKDKDGKQIGNFDALPEMRD